MTITSIVENTATWGLRAKHGLALYIQTENHKILFDLGPDNTLFKNADKLGIDLSRVDTVIISHGHRDHGGALGNFLKINSKAKIYIQEKAFRPHYTGVRFMKFSVSLDNRLKNHPQIQLLNGDYKIDDELYLFTVQDIGLCHSPANDVLYDDKGPDTFRHEQNLIIKGTHTALIMGCGHRGVVNIMKKAGDFCPDICVGGFHLYNPISQKVAPDRLLKDIARRLSEYKTDFYTYHCTGKKAYKTLAGQMTNLTYLSCGESVNI